MRPVAPDQLGEVTALRRELHAHPELSGAEEQTARRICTFLAPFRPDELITGVGGHGVLAVFDSGRAGRTVMVRSELDALPIAEANSFAHRSTRPGIAHMCGHDGHMATVAGLAAQVRAHGLRGGRLVLLFQPAEETGEGAAAMLADPRFAALAPDLMFAFHNLPRFPLHQVVVRDGTFACASVGMRVQLQGTGSHSSYPEHGRSPAVALAELIARLAALARPGGDETDLSLVTVTQAQLGDLSHKVDYGVAPASGWVVAVLRAARQQRLESLKATALELVQEVAGRHQLEATVSWHEEFAATENSTEAVALVRAAARAAGLDVAEVAVPFRWSEDFGLFLQRFPGALFGLGSGADLPQLHNEHYDFPDALLPTGLTMLWSLVERACADPPTPD